MANRTIIIDVNGNTIKAIVTRTDIPVCRVSGLLRKPMAIRKQIKIAAIPTGSDEQIVAGVLFSSLSGAVQYVRSAISA